MQAKAAGVGEQGAAVDVNGRLIVVEDDGTIIIGPGREQAAMAATGSVKDSTEVEYLTGEKARGRRGGPSRWCPAGSQLAGRAVGGCSRLGSLWALPSAAYASAHLTHC